MPITTKLAGAKHSIKAWQFINLSGTIVLARIAGYLDAQWKRPLRSGYIPVTSVETWDSS